MLHLRKPLLPPFPLPPKPKLHASPFFSFSLPSSSFSSSSSSSFPSPSGAKSITFLSSSSGRCRAAKANAPSQLPPSSPRNKPSRLAAAISLIVGTAVGPGMLGLPAATVTSGPLPSSAAIILTWIYVVSSILLIAELTSHSMNSSSLSEVTFTSLAADAFGRAFGSFVSLIYASLNLSLVVACVSGIGSLLTQTLHFLPPLLANSLFPSLIGLSIAFLPFKAVDAVNRGLCSAMIASIVGLVAVGVSVGRSHLLDSFKTASWSVPSLLPAIPVTVLTFGFHVITPFMCKVVEGNVDDARKAIMIGGAIPLLMVLSWNLVILGLSGSGAVVSGDPIGLLLSVNPHALPAVRGFALSALSTSLVGYAVSFPKQLMDTIELTLEMAGGERFERSKENLVDEFSGSGSGEGSSGESGLVSRRNKVTMWVILVVAVLLGTYLQAAFSKALDFAGIYANCFLFGILPPAMAWIHRSRRGHRTSFSLLPGGNVTLLLLFVSAILLMFWH